VSRSTTQTQEVHLHVAVRGSNQTQIDGLTEYISKRDIRFAVNKPFAVDLGAPLDLFVTVPTEITAGYQVFIRVRGQVRCIEYVPDSGAERLTLTAAVKGYEFVRENALLTPRLGESRAMALGAAS
jgi:hypothetical protein